MSAAAQLEHVYRYPFASHVEPGWGLHLATSGSAADEAATPYFFEGKLEHPEELAKMLLLLSDVVRSRFYLPGAMRQLDPVVTCSDQVVRFEGFSSCCGVYVRVDAEGDSFEHGLKGRGTTNVDFNSPMRAALGRIRADEEVRLAVGADEVKLTRSEGSAVEKKVQLPLRWLKAFLEVQAYQARLQHRLEVDGVTLRRFLRTLPKSGGPKRRVFVVPAGRELRLTQRESKDGVPVMGTDRLSVLASVLAPSQRVNVWVDPDTGVSGWEVSGAGTRALVLLSPEVYRGFSGEGQALRQLAGSNWEGALASVRAKLKWQSELDASALARELGKPLSDVEAALAVLGSRGLVGFDATRGVYFHRELPFDLSQIETLQPRLKAARGLVTDGKVRLNAELREAVVEGSDVQHRVRLLEDGDRCTCRWFSKHQGQRGPCKHILAARISLEGDDDSEQR